MTAQYGRRPLPRAWRDAEYEGWQDRPSLYVHEDAEGPEPTGLLDQWGNDLYRLPPERAPIGFDLTGGGEA